MIDFYRFEDRNKLRTAEPIFSLDADKPGTPGYALCEHLSDQTGLFIDPYGDTRLMRPHLEVLWALMKSGEYGAWDEAIKALEDRIETSTEGLIAVGD